MRIDCPTPKQLPWLKELWREAFGEEEAFMEAFFTAAYAPQRCRIVTEGDAVAAMVHWLDGECRGRKYAYLYAVATCKAFQGRGLCRRLLADTHDQLSQHGYAGAILYPADEGLRGMYGKMGYRDLGQGREWRCTPGEPVALRKIGIEEYEVLRRAYLPEDGLIQERENLALLAKTADLYAGDGFLLAASPEGENLTGMELLGREAAAPGIVAALGCTQGVFHRGRQAMIRLLAEETEAPKYVGLVFD